MATNPLVSVIIPSYRAGSLLDACLSSVRAQASVPGRVEILVVDRFSRDGSRETARRHKARFFERGPERSAQRNFGATKARGRFLLMLDADMTLSPFVVRDAVRGMRRPGCAGLFVPETVVGEGFWARVRDFERSFYDGTAVDAVRFFRRDVFWRAGGYDTALWAAEDWDLDRRLRRFGTFDSIPSPLFHREGRFRWGAYLRKKAYYSGNFDRYLLKWGDDPVTRLQFGWAYRYFGVFMEKGKWRKLLSHPLLAASMGVLRILVGCVFLLSRIRGRKPGAASGPGGTG